jgi:hypothetical protein
MRAFSVGGTVLSSTKVYDWCFPRDRSRARSQAARWSVRRVLREIADPIGRAETRGRPWLWRLKTPAAESYPCRQIEIIAEIGGWPILPISVTMFSTARAMRTVRPLGPTGFI